jgi:choline-sulfatase
VAPNILLVMVDQLAAGWLPAYGHDVVSAPHVDALAAAGTVYESAYTASPLCAPSRSALLTGRLPSRTGVYDNAAELRASEPTLMHHLRAAGWHTCLSGKMHFVGPDQLHGFEERLTTDVYPSDLDWTPDWRVPLTERLPWYHSMESVLTPGECLASMEMDYDDEVARRAVRKLLDLARARDERPFFLVASFTHPHDPWELHPRYWARYDDAEIDLPAVGMIPRGEADPHSLRLRDMAGIDDVTLSEEQIRRARHAYYAAISYVDERIGEVLGALRETGLDQDTIVVFTADHGEMLGERGLWYKMAFFEGAARVPLIISTPGRAPGRVREPVSLLDVAPTLLDLCGVPGADMDGTSLTSTPTHDVVGEYLAEGVNSPLVMLRRGRHKYLWCADDPELCFDLEDDPHELRALEAPEGLRAEVERRWDMPALNRAVLASQRDRRGVVAALRRGRPERWDWVPRPEHRFVTGADDLYALQRRARLDA